MKHRIDNDWNPFLHRIDRFSEFLGRSRSCITTKIDNLDVTTEHVVEHIVDTLFEFLALVHEELAEINESVWGLFDRSMSLDSFEDGATDFRMITSNRRMIPLEKILNWILQEEILRRGGTDPLIINGVVEGELNWRHNPTY